MSFPSPALDAKLDLEARRVYHETDMAISEATHLDALCLAPQVAELGEIRDELRDIIGRCEKRRADWNAKTTAQP